jgi:tRNA U34 2-thiouridine synthase MnmA/TrmU
VVEKNIEKNEIVVGDENDMKLYDDRLYVKDFHFLTSPPVSLLQGERSIKAHAKIRYRQ